MGVPMLHVLLTGSKHSESEIESPLQLARDPLQTNIFELTTTAACSDRSAPIPDVQVCRCQPRCTTNLRCSLCPRKNANKIFHVILQRKEREEFQVNESWKALTKDAAMQFTDTSKPHCSPSLVGSAVFVTKEGLKKRTRWAIFHQNLTDEDMHHGRTPDRAQMITSPIACSEMQCGAAIGMECKLVCHIKGLARNQQFVKLKVVSPFESLQQLPGQLRILWSWSPMCPMCNALPKTDIGLEALLFSLTPQFGILHRHSIVVQSLIAKVHKIILQMQISIRGDAPNWSAAQPSLQEHHKRSAKCANHLSQF